MTLHSAYSSHICYSAASSLSYDGNEDGCEPVPPPGLFEILPHLGWIALVQRGSCSFADKIRAMQKSGARGVIVGDNADNSELITMYASEDTNDITIPSVFISKSSFRDLRFLSQYTERLIIPTIHGEGSGPPDSDANPEVYTLQESDFIETYKRLPHLLVQLEKNDMEVPLVSGLSPVLLMKASWRF